MVISNMECIDYLEGWDRLAKMDPKLRKIIIDRAVKGLKLLEANESSTKINAKKVLDRAIKMQEIRALSNRATAMMKSEVDKYMTPESLASGKPCPEDIFLKNIILIFCEIVQIDKSLTSEELLDNILFLYMAALKPMCRYTTGGTMCAFCNIRDCELSVCKTPEEKEKWRKKIEQELTTDLEENDK